MTIYEVIKRPLVTEKSNLMKDLRNTYVFEVARQADKGLVKKAVESLFKVKVASVRTTVVPGKTKKGSGNNQIKTQQWKKAVVTLADGKIELFEGV